MQSRLLLAAILSFAASIASAKDDPILFKCNYSTFSDEKGLKTAEKGFQLQFMIEPKTRKSYFIGNNGSSEVKLVKNTDGITLSRLLIPEM